MGRLKKSAAEKRLSGNPGKRKILDDVEIEIISETTPPEGMGAAQVAYWGKYAPYMVKNNLLNSLNFCDVRRLCYFESALDSVLEFLAINVASMVQEKKNYHGDVVDLVESTYSKIARNYAAVISRLKADLRLRTDKFPVVPTKKRKSKFEGLLNVSRS